MTKSITIDIERDPDSPTAGASIFEGSISVLVLRDKSATDRELIDDALNAYEEARATLD